MGIVSHRTKWKKKGSGKVIPGAYYDLDICDKKTQTQAKVAAHPLPTLCFSKV